MTSRTLFMTLLTGLKAVLLVRTGRKDICVATPMANRAALGTDRVIGQFDDHPHIIGPWFVWLWIGAFTYPPDLQPIVVQKSP
jgi:hypothetical protein